MIIKLFLILNLAWLFANLIFYIPKYFICKEVFELKYFLQSLLLTYTLMWGCAVAAYLIFLIVGL